MKPSRPYHSSTAYHREPGGLRRLDFFIDRIERTLHGRPRASMRVLDIGCGNGNLALACAAQGYDVVGMDFDRASIARARQSAADLSLTHVRFLEGSLEQLHDEKFDVIVASEVLEHQKNPSAFLADVASRLVPGGLLLLSVPNGKSLEERIRKFTTHTSAGLWLKTRLKRLVRHQDVQSSATHPHEQFFSLRELEEVLRSNGWRIRELQQASAFFKEFFYLFGRLFIRRGSRVFHAFDALDAAISSSIPMSMADGWLLETLKFDPTRPLVMHVLPTLSSGGAERFVYDVAKLLPANGFDVQMIATQRGGPLEQLFQRDLPLTILHARGPSGVMSVFRLYVMFRRERPHVVHTHLFGADVWGRIAAWLAGVPVIISTEHNVNVDHGYFKRRIKGWLAPITTAFIALSQGVKTNMIAQEFIPAKKIQIILNGIDLSRVVVRPPRGLRDVPRLMTVGRLVTQKGHAALFKALALVKGSWSLEIIGSGPLEGELRELAERLSIAPRIHWLGFRDDVPQRFAESDVFIFPSRWEGFGLALYEAVASGIPCIASDLSVFHEFLSPTEVTFVPVGDVPALAHAVQELLRDPYAAVERGAAAGERVRQVGAIETTVAEYARLYRRCLKNAS